ncbi:MAG: response regulator [Deltaproteobacteria bacterium]|nr:response regulator [Deltaproteobacteria bacterium]
MSSARLLVVEDERIVAKDIQSRLRGLGYCVPALASSGAEAIRKAAEMRPDLALMDIVLKGEMDGVEAAAYLREHLGIPVVYLTAHGDDVALERAKATQPFGYILKPFDERELHSTIKMALYKSRIEKELQESGERLLGTLRSIGDAVVATDAAGCVLFMNPVAECLTGWKQEEAFAKDVVTLLQWVNGKSGESMENPVITALREGRSIPLGDLSTFVARDGTRIPTEGCASAIRGAKGEEMGIVLVFRDARERRQAQEELERANRSKSELLDVLSHDLKTPLNVIAGYASMIRENHLKDWDQALGKIIQHAHHLALMIDGLLEISRVEAGATEVVKQETRLGLFFDELRSLYDFSLAKKVVLVWDCPSYLPTVMIDRIRLRQVMQNLINNAIKFTAKGKVSVRVRCAPLLRLLEVKVTDTGVGIPREKIPLIFERFRQVESTEQTKVRDGAGLGLYIVESFTRMLGGEIEVESTPGKGSTFTVILPYDL